MKTQLQKSFRQKSGLLVAGLTVLLLGKIFAQTTVPGGNVSGNWTFAGSPYLVQGSIMISNDSTLTIDPGVTVEFQGQYKLLVLGRLLAIGTQTDSITFTAANIGNGWRGIRFDNTTVNNDTSKIIYCKLLYGKATGASPDNNGGAFYFRNFSKSIISRCIITNCAASAGGGIYCESSSPSIFNNTISNNASTSGGGGIYCYGFNPTIYSNNISNNTTLGGGGGGINCGYGNPIIINNTISNNTANDIGGGISINGGSPVIFNNESPLKSAFYEAKVHF